MSSSVEFRHVFYRDILRDLTLKVSDSETLVLLGRSGAGKTTALRMVNGLVRPTRGEVLVDGRPVDSWDLIRLRRQTGYVIQETGLFPHFTVAQNVGLVPRLEGWDSVRIAKRVDELLEQVGLPPERFRSRYPRELSGGQRQRVGVARALAANPPLLLLDEPFGAVDPVTRAELQRQFLELRGRLRVTAIFVTHDVREALVLGTRIGLMRQGKLAVLGTPEEFRQHPDEEVRLLLETASLGGTVPGKAWGMRS